MDDFLTEHALSALDRRKLHERTIVMLAEEEAAFNTVAKAAARVLSLRNEFLKMDKIEVIPAPATDLLESITAAARDPAVDVAKIQVLLETAERLAKFTREREFNNAMRACQEEIGPIARTAENKHTGGAYTPLEAIDREIKPVYTSHGFVMSFGSTAATNEHSVRVTCDVRHQSGHTVRYELEGELDSTGMKGTQNKTPITALGSTVTHLRRYLTLMIWNVALVDRGQLFLTKEQANNVSNMLDAAGITGDRMRQFLKFAGADTVETIGSFRYNELIVMLRRAEANRRNSYPSGHSSDTAKS